MTLVIPNNEVFKFYFEFIQNRMDIFWSKYKNELYPWTNDSILREYKFTNVYRVCDRVSQYLIRNVIYTTKENYNELDIIFRIFLFKIFNKIETWEYLESKFGSISLKTFNPLLFSKELAELNKNNAIFNCAYIMNGYHHEYRQYLTKIERWLYMLDYEFIRKHGFLNILQLKSLGDIYHFLVSKPLIGSFLAYQYSIDFNYSNIFNFSENDFVKAGPGAISGIKKCFINMRNYTSEDIIKYTYDNFESFQKYYGYTKFKPLFGRYPTLVDLQNCFCETDKYLRVKIPCLKIGNIQIKQKYKYNNNRIHYCFPSKWELKY